MNADAHKDVLVVTAVVASHSAPAMPRKTSKTSAK
jgi:hypothetical protein